MRKFIALLSLFYCLTNIQGFAQSALGLYFDGVDDRATIPNNSAYNLNSNSTFQVWIKVDSVQSNSESTIFSTREAGNPNTGIQLLLVNGKIAARFGGVLTPVGTTDLRDGLCHYIIMTRSFSGYISIYVDGLAPGSFSVFNQSITTTHALWVGADEPTLATSRFKGVIHELRIWNSSVSSFASSNRYNYLYGNEANLVGYWRLNDAAGTQSLDDLSVTNNDGCRGTTTSAETSDPASVTSCMCSTTAAITSVGGTVICNAAGITLSANTGTGLTYSWLKNGATISGATLATYTAITAGTYTCRVLSGNCGNTSNAIVMTATNPSVTISNTGNSYICTGSSVILNSTVTNGGTPTYQWKLNGNNIAGATLSSCTATQTGTYSLLVSNTSNGCSALSSNTINLTVFTSIPVATISYPYSSQGCGGVTMNVAAGNIPGQTYQWQLNGTNLSSSNYYAYNATTSGPYTCVVSNACGTASSNALTPTILGTGYITYSGSTNLCNGSIALYAPYIIDAGYQWKNNGTDIAGANSYSYTATGAGNYSCVIVSNQCGILSSLNSVAVDGSPSIASLSSLEFCTGGSTSLIAYGDSSKTAYQWTLNGTNIASAVNQSYTTSISGTYACQVTSTVCGVQTSNSLVTSSGTTPQISLIGPAQPGGSQIDVCNYSSGIVYVTPANAGTYSMYEMSNNFLMYTQPDNTFYTTGTGYYYITLDNGCGTSQSNSFGVTDINSTHYLTSDYGTNFCSNSSLPYLYISTYSFWFGSSGWSPIWDSYNWKLNGASIPGGSNNTIQPTQTGWYSCTLNNSCGTALYVDSLFITVSQLPASATVTASGPLTFCQGQSVIFTANVVAGATYKWYRGTSQVQSSTSNTYTATISGTYKVAIVNGSCNPVNSADQVVTVNIPPSQYISTNSPATLCSPGSITLTAPPGNTYEWYSSQTTGILGTSSTFTATTTANYYVKVIDAQGCYYNSYYQNVAISNPITITTSQYSSNCENGNVQLTCNFVGTSLSYQWKKNGTIISGANTTYYTFAGGSIGIGAYTLDVTTECGVITSNTFNYSTYIPFAATCTPNGSVTACTPATVTMNATTGSNLTYLWYKDGSTISNATTASYAASSTGRYGVYIRDIVTGCNTNTYSILPTIINYGNQVLSISPATGQYFCNSVTLTVNGIAGSTYQWLRNNSAISGATAQSYTATTSGTYSVTISNSCGTATASKAVVISTSVLPALSITSNNPNTQCQGSYVLLSVTPGQVSGTVTCQWKLNGTNISNTINPSYSTTSGVGSYTCEVTNGCGTTTTSAYNLVYNPLPVATISAAGPTNLCNGASVTLNAATGTGYSYQWSSNGIVITGATSSAYTTTVGGTYRCKTTDANACTATSTFINVFTSSGTAPTASITPSGTVNICTGATQTLTANTGGGYSYQWKKNGTNISGATGLTYGATTAGAYTVVVTSACGSATSSGTTVNIGSAAATITPSGPTTLCSGSVVLNANTGTGLSYQWKNNGSNIAGATGASYTAASSGSYTVVVTATGGCSATSAATVVTIGALSAAVTPSGTVTLCSGTGTTLSATAGTGYTYQWYRNNVLLSATTQTYTTSTQGTYKCVVTSGTCSATTGNVVIVVNTTPAATVSYSTPLSFCSPGSVTFTANALSGAAYQWENNSVAISGATAQTYVATTAGAYRVKETRSGCIGYSSVKTVTAATSATAAISTTDPTTQCTGGIVNMSITGPVPGYTYQWKKNTVNIAGATGSTYAATTTGSYTVTATASCGTATSNAIAVTIGSVSAVVTPSGTATLCSGSTLTLAANTGTGYGYQWKNNNVNIAGATSATYTVTTGGSYTVAITSPCGNATSAATVVTQAATVTAALTPSGSSTVCSGSSITLTANAGTGYTYRWYRNNVLLTPTTQTFTTSTAGSYKVEVSISGSCAVQSNTSIITVTNNPTATVTAGGPTTFCAGQSVTFTANTYAGVTQQWQKNSVNIAGATNQTYTATTGGNYRVQQTANGCTKNSAQNAVTVNCRVGQNGEELSSDETGTATQMNVYPNPFEDKLNINITSPVTEQTEIKVMDVLGKVQYSQMITTNTTTELNMQLPAGIYMITTIVEGEMKTLRVVKAN